MAFRREKKKAGWKPALLLAPGSNARLKAIHAHHLTIVLFIRAGLAYKP